MLSALVSPGGTCDHLMKTAPTPNFSGISTTSVSPPSTVQEKPGYAGQYEQCRLTNNDVWDRVQCGVDLGIINEPPELGRKQRAEAAAESATSSAIAAANSLEAKQDAELSQCLGARGSSAGTIRVLAVLLSLVAAFLAYRRFRALAQAKSDAETAHQWDQNTPPGAEIETSDRELAAVVHAARNAADEEEQSSGVWFGGNGARSFELREIAARAEREQSNRVGGYGYPGPVAPTAAPTDFTVEDDEDDDAIPVAQDVANWASKLSEKGDEW